MTTFVVEFGAKSLTAILVAIQAVVGSIEGTIEVIDSASESAVEFTIFNGEIAKALKLLEGGEIKALLVRRLPRRGTASIMVFCPHFSGGQLPLWHGVVDGLVTSDVVLHALEDLRDLNFISVAVDDSLDLQDIDAVDVESFPWEHWRLVEAAVADTQGRLLRRAGPARRKLSDPS